MVERVAYRNAGECACEHVVPEGIVWRESFIAARVSDLVVSILRLDCPYSYSSTGAGTASCFDISSVGRTPGVFATEATSPAGNCRLFLAFHR